MHRQTPNRPRIIHIALVLAATLLAACADQSASMQTQAPVQKAAMTSGPTFEQDREAILAMSGVYRVSFNFIETVAFAQGYDIPEPKGEGGNEVVRVIQDDGDFISLQHFLVVGSDHAEFVVKHWRQDWQYEPTRIFEFVGGNAWRMVETNPADVKGKWVQSVYQVDDAPRYAAIADWVHEDGVSSWTGPRTWRPLPRRDAMTRDDYDVVDGINRHAITAQGWVHEQDNAKVELRGQSQVLVREIAYNVYRKYDAYNYGAADKYWANTKAFWAPIRAEWRKLEAQSAAFGLTIQGEPEELYMKILEEADAVNSGDKDAATASKVALAIIHDYTTMNIGTLASRIEKRKQLAQNDE